MTTKTKKYELRGLFPRNENGKQIQPGAIVTLAHLSADDIAKLLQFSVYKEVK